MANCWHISLSVLHLQSQDIANNDCGADGFALSSYFTTWLKDFAISKYLTGGYTLHDRLSQCNISQKCLRAKNVRKCRVQQYCNELYSERVAILPTFSSMLEGLERISGVRTSIRAKSEEIKGLGLGRCRSEGVAAAVQLLSHS